MVRITSLPGCGGSHCFGTLRRMLVDQSHVSMNGRYLGLADVTENILTGTVSAN
jgi:hypothetical protein